MSVKQFCAQSSIRVMQGIHQEIGIAPSLGDYIPTGYASARVMTLKLVGVNPHYLTQIRGMQDQLTMWAGLDNKSRVRIGWQGTNILIEIPKPPQYWKQITIETMQDRRMIKRGAVATIGLGLQDEPKRINFNEAAMAHVFITGQTRSGKTNAQRLIGWNLCRNTTPDDTKLIIFDVAKRGYKWRDFGNVVNLAHPVVTDVAEAEAVLTWLVSEIDRRSVQGYITPRLFVLIDELKALTDDSDICRDKIARIASVGGEFGLHLILATQYPQVKMLGSAELKRNITTRLCGKVDDANAAANALGIADSGANLLQGYGDFLLKDFDSLSRLTVAKIEPSHVDGLERSETKRLPIQSVTTDAINRPVPKSLSHPSQQPQPFTPEEVAIALYNWGDGPIGVQKLRRLIGGGNLKRVERLRRHAGTIIHHMQQMGDECIDFGKKGLKLRP